MHFLTIRAKIDKKFFFISCYEDLTPGAMMLRVRQSSLVGAGGGWDSCGHAGPYRVASSVPVHCPTGWVAANRRGPVCRKSCLRWCSIFLRE